MAKQLFANNASALLASSISDADLTIQVAAGFGQFFPSPGVNEFFLVSLENDDGDIEIVKITSRSTDLLTVPASGRGQDGTSAQSWTNGLTRVELRLTKGTLENFLQLTGGEMSGDIDMNSNDVIDAILSGTGTKITAGEIYGVPLRGAMGDTSNQISVPSNGTRATAGGEQILTAADDLTSQVFTAGMIMLWYGSAGAVPSGWAICDGDNGTPNLRDRFVVGAGSTYSFGATGGATTSSGTTDSGGAHTHTGSTGSTAISIEQMPAHTHEGSFTFPASGDDNSQTPMTMLEGSNVQSLGAVTINNVSVQSQGGGSGHTHSISSDGAHTHNVSSVSTLPPYYALYYIMKTA